MTLIVHGAAAALRMNGQRLPIGRANKCANHIHTLSLYFVWYNFVRIHKTLKVSPAMAAGVSDRLSEMQDIVALMDERAETVKHPRNYKKQGAVRE